ncbi:MAG: ABC transporter substrate-binding protein [Chloroflexi bacterium]|nr:ABC transporter substrate-binding protein [Chloroflexota bacterium]
MSRGTVKVLTVVLVGLLLAALPGLGGCGGGTPGKSAVTLGFLGDFTGPGSAAVSQVFYGLQDYLKMVEENNLVPEGKIKLISYDTRTDSGRVLPGYVWLQGQGAQVVATVSSPDREAIVGKCEQDEVPAIGLQGSTKLMPNKWAFALLAPQEAQAEALMMWINNTWNYTGTGRRPRVAQVGAVFATTEYWSKGLESYAAANTDKFDWVGTIRSPLGQTTWAAESAKVMNCDYVILTIIGPSVPSFLKESRDRGYTGAFLSGIEAFPGFWELVATSVSPSYLYSCYFTHMMPWWNETGEFVDTMKQYMTEHRTASQVQSLMYGTGYISGWATAVYAVDAIKRAMEAAGTGVTTDGDTLRDAFAAMNLSVPQWGNTWVVTPNNGCLARQAKVFKYDNVKLDWFVDIKGDWFLPPTAAIQ